MKINDFTKIVINLMVILSIAVSGAIWAAPIFDVPLCCANAEVCNPPIIEFRGGQGDFFDEGEKKCCDPKLREADCSATVARYCRAEC